MITKSKAETVSFAKDFAKTLKNGDVIRLYGEMGAGKTAFAIGLMQGLNFTGTVSSPTFSLMNVYNGNLSVYHFDLYRIKSFNELCSAGLEEFIGAKNSVALIEWPQLSEGINGERNIDVNFYKLDENVREIKIAAKGGDFDDNFSS